MANKQINARVALKHDIEENWITAGEHDFCPMAGEVIIYDIEEGVCSQLRYKIGRKDSNGQLININDLPFESNVYVGRDEPVNAPAGFIWVDTSEDVKLITFSLDIYDINAWWAGTITETKTYVAEEGMTFKEWIKSSYNTEPWYCMAYDPATGDETITWTEDNHIYGIGRMLYEDGTYGGLTANHETGSGSTKLWWVMNKKVEPRWDIYETDILDCETIITDKMHYWTICS